MLTRFTQALLEKEFTIPNILILLGARQVGKTTLLQSTLPTNSTLFLNLDLLLDKERLLSLASLSPKDAIISLGSPKFLVIDEAQRLPQIGQIVKGWFDSQINTKIILSGSSSLDLLDLSAESLTGRNTKIYLTPLTFSETIHNQPWFPQNSTPVQLESFTDTLFSTMFSNLVFGSYPAIITAEDKIKILSNLVSDYLLKDILQIGLVKNPEFIQKLLSILAFQTGSEVSVNELSSNLKIARQTVDRYLDLLERTFIIFRLPAFSTNPRKEITKNHKVFFWDTGIRNVLVGDLSSNPLRSDIGSLWENWVVAEFAKQNLLTGNLNRLYFWRSQAGSEVDLVIKNISTGQLSAYETKWSSSKVTQVFTDKYHVLVHNLNKNNFLHHLLWPNQL